MGDNTLHCPKQQVVIAQRQPGQQWIILLKCGFYIEFDSKIISASTQATGGKHSTLP